MEGRGPISKARGRRREERKGREGYPPETQSPNFAHGCESYLKYFAVVGHGEAELLLVERIERAARGHRLLLLDTSLAVHQVHLHVRRYDAPTHAHVPIPVASPEIFDRGCVNL